MRHQLFYISLLLVISGSLSSIVSQVPKRTADTLAANNIKMWVMNNGWESYNPEIDSAGFYWPNNGDTRKHAIYLSGIQLGGLINKRFSIGGISYDKSTYNSGVLEFTDAVNDSVGRIWKIKKNWELLDDGQEKEYLKFNYENWPGNLGAPYIDINNDGSFTRGIDMPDFIGDEVIFYSIYNSKETSSLYEDDTNHVAIQINITLWASDSTELLSDVVFEKIEIINKDTVTITDFFAAYWVDADLGYPMDDYVGCAPSLYLGYAWNTFLDDPFYGEIAPAVGHAVLSGFFSDGENLMLSAFGPNFKVSSTSFDPRNSEEHYNVVRGLLTNGDPFINPYNNAVTKFPLSGNPEDSSGWYEGGDWPPGETFGSHPPYPGDRRYYLVSGPVDFSPADTQTIILAHIMALGSSNTNSISLLKDKAYKIHRLFGNDFVVNVEKKNSDNVPDRFHLYQNYPNPFNSQTRFSFDVPFESLITIELYNVLGQKIKTLLNRVLAPGKYEQIIDSGDLSTGVYFIKFDAQRFVKTIKIMVLK